MKNKFLTLWLAGIVGAAAVLPYAFTLQSDVIAKADKPLAVLVLASIAQTAVLLAIAIFFGLRLSTKVRLPVLTLFESGGPTKETVKRLILLTVPVGILTAFAITLGDKIFGQYLPQLTLVNGSIPVWKTLLASLYGGIVEEILMRLFVMSFFVWLLGIIVRSVDVLRNEYIMWTAIAVSAILFGLGHLPITAALTAITPLVVLRAIVLNGIGGLVFGWLSWKRGLEYAMVAHATADIVLLSILPALLR